MKKILIIIYTFLSVAFCSNAQNIKGIITNTEGEPVSFATVYINELRHGTTANIKGEYEIRLKPGKYTVFFQSLGYSPETKIVEVGTSDKEINIRLSIQYYQIPEVRVTATGEDPAYGIMRKAIGMASYHLNRIKHYEADIYIKGSVVINKIPKVVARNIKANDIEVREGDSYLIESMNKIEFEAPDIYNQTVIAQQSTFPDTRQSDISPMDVVRASFYQPVLADIAISPLSPNAMAYYKFSYEGSTPQGPYIVNKIKVIPRRKSQQVFEGTIYIIEDLWCIHSLDLTNENLAGSINIKQVYTPVQDDIWMPVSHNFDVKVTAIGIDAGGTYGSAVTYTSVEPNNDLPKPEDLNLNPTAGQLLLEEQRENTKTQQQIEELLQKKELSNRDMSKLSRLMEKETDKKEEGKEDLEIKKTTSSTVEDDAGKKSSEYWNEIRPIPLSEEEKKSVRVSDSLRLETRLREASSSKDTTGQGKVPKSQFKSVINDILFGETWHKNKIHSRFRTGGLIDPDHFSFNPVDGFKYGIDFNYLFARGKGMTFNITPELVWNFSRESLDWKTSGLITYDHMRQSRIIFWGGRGSKDFTSSAGISPFINMVTSLLFKNNYMKLYDSRYFTLRQRTEYFNGFYIEWEYNYDDRRLLNNNTEFSFFHKEKNYTDNIPLNDYLGAAGDENAAYLLTDHIHHQFSAVISYIPKQKYRINNGKKSSAGSDYPTFKIYYDHGININPGNMVNHFDHIQFEANKSKSIGAFSEYSWRVRAGGFLNNDKLQFQDFIHFNTQSLPFLIRNHQDVFMLPDYYSMATPEYYIEAHFRYTTPYLLIKLLPLISNSLMRENLSIAYLYSPSTGHYYELGYSLSEIFLVGKVGIFAGFEDLNYKSAGLRFTFIFN